MASTANTPIKRSRAEFARELADAMREAKMSQVTLSERVGVAQTTVSRWLAGRMIPRIEYLEKIQACLPGKFDWVNDGYRRAASRPLTPEAGKALQLMKLLVQHMSPAQLENFVFTMLELSLSDSSDQLLSSVSLLELAAAKKA